MAFYTRWDIWYRWDNIVLSDKAMNFVNWYAWTIVRLSAVYGVAFFIPHPGGPQLRRYHVPTGV